jgi:beta-glucosidase
MSYSTFEFGARRLSSATIAANWTVAVTVPVKNTRNCAGDETVQIYVRYNVCSVKDLKAFKREPVASGESKNVVLPLTLETRQIWTDKMQRIAEPGEFDTIADPGSANVGSVTLTVRP